VGIVTLDRNKLTTHLWDKHRIIVTPIAHEEFQGIRVTPNVYTTLIDAFSVAMEKVMQSGV
jgi:isopenicillin-N epimerase